jgi:MoaA/NifB/PqqE/SkfB family radical SAM enzyme
VEESDMERKYSADHDFTDHFKSLHQVFMYITDRCNLECEQCIYKPSISHYINEEIALHDALGLLRKFHDMGATKVTFLGGEPTIYGHKEGGKPLLNLLEGTKNIGYDYIRMDTNGQTIASLLDHVEFSNLNEIAFSLDGFSPETNDPLRGAGTFVRAVTAIKKSLVLGYRVTITCCIQKLLLERDDE